MVAAPVRTHTFAFCVPSSPWWREEKTQLSGTTLHTLLIFPCSANRTDKEKPRIFWKEERNPSDAPSFSWPNGPSTPFPICHSQGRLLPGEGERRKWVRGKKREGRKEQLGLAARRAAGAAPSGGGEGQNKKGRTPRQSPKDKDARHLPPSLSLCPHSNRAGKYQSQSTNINPSHTNNSASPLLSIPNSPNAPPPLSLLPHR